MQQEHASGSVNLQSMIDGQLRPNGVTDHALLARVAAVPRAAFARPETDPARLHLDQPLALSATRQLLPPRTAARLIQALAPDADSHVLIAAAGTGYEAALLAPLVAQLTVCEDDPSLLPQLRANLKDCPNVTVLPFGPAQALAVSAPFKQVLVAAPWAVLPPALVNLVAEGGCVAGVQVDAAGTPTALIRTRHGKSWLEETLFESPAGPVHPAMAASEHFVF